MSTAGIVLFASDLHGITARYEKLFTAIRERKPSAVLLGGDLLPHALIKKHTSGFPAADFVLSYLRPALSDLKEQMKEAYPLIAVIMGNDDPRAEEENFLSLQESGLWQYIHNRSILHRGFTITGYAYVPPTPFALKDWERYDVSRYVDPGCSHPDEGKRTAPVDPNETEWSTIAQDLLRLSSGVEMSRSVWLFHSPPYQTGLDRAALDNVFFDHVPLDVHVGSIAIKRFIESEQPLLTLHGHIHESSRITGIWKEKLGQTIAVNAAAEKGEFCLISFEPDKPEEAVREIMAID